MKKVKPKFHFFKIKLLRERLSDYYLTCNFRISQTKFISLIIPLW